jgi:RND family efflux transporter MFP subunit
MLPYILRPSAIEGFADSAIARSQFKLQGMRIHFWGGYATIALIGFHFILPMAQPALLRTNRLGILLASGAALLVVGLLFSGLRLRIQSLVGRLAIRRLHFSMMLGAVSLSVGHVALNSPILGMLSRPASDAPLPMETHGIAPTPTPPVEGKVTSTGVVRLQVGGEVRVGSQVSGIVEKLYVTIGSHIEKGDVIAEIDARELEARISSARAQVEIDKVSVQKAQRDVERDKPLASKGVIPNKDFEDLEAAAAAARAALGKSQSDLALQEVDRAYVRILSPITGTVASVSTQEGETVAAAFAAPTFVTIIKDHDLELVALIDETDIGRVRVGDPVVFTTEAFPSEEFQGTVERIAPTATITSGVVNYEVGVAISRETSDRLKPDMTANVTIQTSTSEASSPSRLNAIDKKQ